MGGDPEEGKCQQLSWTTLMCKDMEQQITAVVDGLLCGLVGKTVARLEENCKRLWGDGFDRAGVGCGLA